MSRTAVTKAPAALLVAALAATAGLATAGEVNQSINYQLGVDEYIQNVSFAQFDTMGGTRVLTGVTVGIVADLTMSLDFQNFSPTNVAAGDWEGEAYHNILFSFLSGEGEGERGSAPFYGLGGIGTGPVTGDLGPGTGGIFGEGGTPVSASVSDSINSVVGTDPFFFTYFTGNGTLDAVIGPFTDIVIAPPADGSQVSATNIVTTQNATLTLTYTFDVVPAPSGVATFGLLGLAAARRRRV